ncbi:hypothetical protein UA08_08713 [Talaromyces atroroseus]|uniref:MARVEL domain-containing protein n=1 Tax=Talaromyces atroroseus TaxID=1441469 RepID=A0A225ADL2_TALAT|nr:hypothetical protein UA08_08713 [Talaromyces atroroseus]OKL56034.1 hypothetical protein UA08_08713 [Talaromyces atroroseus]
MASVSSVSVTISHPSSASDVQEAAYLSRARTLHWIRMGLAITILGAATGVVGSEGESLSYYNVTKSYSRVGLSLWPLNLDIRGTYALLACGAVILFQAIIYITMAFFPSPYPRTRLLNLLSSAVGLCSLIIAIVGVAFSIYLPSAKYPDGYTVGETIHSWTCKWDSLNGVNGTNANGKPLTAPSHFSRICTDSEAGFVLMGLLVGLEVLMGAAGAAGFLLDLTVSRQRKLSNAEAGEFVMETKH